MSNHAVPLAFLLVASAASGASAADWPLDPPRDRPMVLQDRMAADAYRYGAPPAQARPHGRQLNSGPGYVGSDYGLGKPAFTGLGTRPDWGFSE